MSVSIFYRGSSYRFSTIKIDEISVAVLGLLEAHVRCRRHLRNFNVRNVFVNYVLRASHIKAKPMKDLWLKAREPYRLALIVSSLLRALRCVDERAERTSLFAKLEQPG
jgi:hypothetical protein